MTHTGFVEHRLLPTSARQKGLFHVEERRLAGLLQTGELCSDLRIVLLQVRTEREVGCVMDRAGGKAGIIVDGALHRIAPELVTYRQIDACGRLLGLVAATIEFNEIAK